MGTPVPEVRVDWRGRGHNFIPNDLFEDDAFPWSVNAGIQAAGTSITRVTSGVGMTLHDSLSSASAGRIRAGELVTTAVNGSGVKCILEARDALTLTFTSGRTYRFRVWIASVSGTTSAKITIGSLGTVGDRASATMTLTTSLVAYSVDWTPSANRTDVQVNITNNAAAIMTARFVMAEVYEAINDISADVEYLTLGNGANFDGSSASPGSAQVRVRNYDGKYSPANGSSSLTGLLKLNRDVFIRARADGPTYAAAVLADAPLMQLRLGEPSGTFADSSGNGRTGTAIGSLTYDVTGALVTDDDGAVQLDGSSAFVRVADDAPLDFTSGGMTFEAWIKWNGVRGGFYDAIFGKGTLEPFLFVTTTGKVEFAKADEGTILQSTANVITDTSWHHVAVSYRNGVSAALYLDGQPVSTGALTDRTFVANTTEQGIGSKYGSVADGSFHGSIDEVAIYATALSSDRILAHFNAVRRQTEVFGLYDGSLRRLVPDPVNLTAELSCEDALYRLSRTETNVALNIGVRSLGDFREDALIHAGVDLVNVNLVSDGSEIAAPWTWASARNVQNVLGDINAASGAIHYIAPRCSSWIGWEYETRGRLSMESDTGNLLTWNDNLTSLSGYDHTDEAVINQQRATAHPRSLEPSAIVWESDAVPFTVDASSSVTVWASFDDPVLSASVAYTATNSPTVTLTAFGDAAKIVITAGGTASTVTALSVTGQQRVDAQTQAAVIDDTASQASSEYGLRAGSAIDSPYLGSLADAAGVAGWIVYRYKAAKARPTLSFTNRFESGSHQLTATIGRAGLLTFPRLSIASQRAFIRSYSHTCDLAATQWTSQIDVEEAPALIDAFVLDSAALNGAKVLGY